MQYFRNKDLHKLKPWLKEIEKEINDKYGSSWNSDRKLHVFFDGILGTKKSFAVTGTSDSYNNAQDIKYGILEILKNHGATGIIGKVTNDKYVDIAFDFKPKIIKELGIEEIDWNTYYNDEYESLNNLPRYINPLDDDAIKYYENKKSLNKSIKESQKDWKYDAYKKLHDLAIKQSCFDNMEVFSFYENIQIEICDRYSYFKVENLLPSITHSSLHLSYKFDKTNKIWSLICDWEDENLINDIVRVIELIVETCEKANVELEKTSQTIWKIMEK